MSELFTSNVNQEANDIIDINIQASKRKRIRINQDDSKILELDTTDLSIVSRFQQKYQEMIKLVETCFSNMPVSEDGDDMEDIGTSLANVDTQMRKVIDEIFNSNVSEICAPTGSMLDPINGKFRFEHIFEALFALYETDINSELNKLNSRVQKHTSKYIK